MTWVITTLRPHTQLLLSEWACCMEDLSTYRTITHTVSFNVQSRLKLFTCFRVLRGVLVLSILSHSLQRQVSQVCFRSFKGILDNVNSILWKRVFLIHLRQPLLQHINNRFQSTIQLSLYFLEDMLVFLLVNLDTDGLSNSQHECVMVWCTFLVKVQGSIMRCNSYTHALITLRSNSTHHLCSLNLRELHSKVNTNLFRSLTGSFSTSLNLGIKVLNTLYC